MMENKLSFEQFSDRLRQEGAFVDNENHIRYANGKQMSRMCRNGYYMVRKMVDGQMYHFMEHRIIWYWHNGSIARDMVINHKDFDRSNNSIENLEMVSQSDNIRYSRNANRYPDQSGENNSRAKLSKEEVQAIRYMSKNGWKQKDLAVLFNAHNKNLISRVVTKARYGNVEDAASIISIYPTIIKQTAKSDLTPTERLQNAALGLAGEAGEVVDIIKKVVFQGHEMNPTELLMELGDVAYYFCWIANEVGLDFSEICFANMDKLNTRYPNGFDANRSIHRPEYEGGTEVCL